MSDVPPRRRVIVLAAPNPLARVFARSLSEAGFDTWLLTHQGRLKAPARSLSARLRPWLSHPLRSYADRRYRRGYLRDFEAQEALRDWALAQRRDPPPHPYQRESVGAANSDQTFTRCRDLAPDFLFVFGAPVLRSRLTQLARLEAINLHTGALPRFGGSTPEFWTLFEGAGDQAAFTLHRVEPDLDQGAVFLGERIDAISGEHERSLRRRLVARAAQRLPALLDALAAGRGGPCGRPAEAAGGLVTRPAYDLHQHRALHRRLGLLPRRKRAGTKPRSPRSLAGPGFAWPGGARAAFAISSDIDDCTRERYEELHAFFTGAGKTRWGTGLGWPFAHSVFALSGNPRGAALHAWDHRSDGPLSPRPETARLLEHIRTGAIDALHAYGDFNDVGGFTRELAQAILARAEQSPDPRDHWRLPIWVNHGDRRNRQNLGPGAEHFQGDQPGAPEYHADLLPRLGVRYLWVDALTEVIGQGRAASLGERLFRLVPGRGAPRTLAMLVAGLAHGLQSWRVLTKLLHKLGWHLYLDNRLLWEHTLRDHQRFLAFRRYGRWDSASADTVERVLSPVVFDTLERRGGAMIWYTHLGKGEFSAQGLQALRDLDRRYRQGRIWIATVPTLLDHVAGHKNPEG